MVSESEDKFLHKGLEIVQVIRMSDEKSVYLVKNVRVTAVYSELMVLKVYN